MVARTRTLSHFLYIPDREAAERAGRALAQAGFRSEAGPAADGDDWLLIATHDAIAEKDREVATQEAMREIALAVGGHYNGFEVRTWGGRGEAPAKTSLMRIGAKRR